MTFLNLFLNMWSEWIFSTQRNKGDFYFNQVLVGTAPVETTKPASFLAILLAFLDSETVNSGIVFMRARSEHLSEKTLRLDV